VRIRSRQPVVCESTASPRAALGRALAPLLALLIALLPLQAAFGQAVGGKAVGSAPDDPDKRCLQCHGQAHIGKLTPAERLSMVGTWLGSEPRPATDGAPLPTPALDGTEPEARPNLYVTREALAGSVHANAKCVDCHEDAARLPHQPKLNLQTCATTCHTKAAQAFPTGAHADALKRGDPLAPTCASCHGGHNILPISDRQSPQHRLNSIFLCADCHEKHMKPTPGGYASRRRTSRRT
jgi:hypothetical protein